VTEDLTDVGVRKWRGTAKHREKWRKATEEAKAHPELLRRQGRRRGGGGGERAEKDRDGDGDEKEVEEDDDDNEEEEKGRRRRMTMTTMKILV
jgi:hypothetical protein